MDSAYGRFISPLLNVTKGLRIQKHLRLSALLGITKMIPRYIPQNFSTEKKSGMKNGTA